MGFVAFLQPVPSTLAQWSPSRGLEGDLSPTALAFGGGVGRIGEESLAVRCPFELALEPSPEMHVLFALGGGDREAALFIEGEVTVRVGVLVCTKHARGGRREGRGRSFPILG